MKNWLARRRKPEAAAIATAKVMHLYLWCLFDNLLLDEYSTPNPIFLNENWEIPRGREGRCNDKTDSSPYHICNQLKILSWLSNAARRRQFHEAIADRNRSAHRVG